LLIGPGRKLRRKGIWYQVPVIKHRINQDLLGECNLALSGNNRCSSSNTTTVSHDSDAMGINSQLRRVCNQPSHACKGVLCEGGGVDFWYQSVVDREEWDPGRRDVR